MAKEGREEDKAGKGEEMKKILLLSYRICFPIAITAIFLILLPRVLLFFLPFTLGAVLALLSEPLIRLGRKAFPFLKKDQLSVLVILLLFLLFATLLYLLILLLYVLYSDLLNL